MKFADLKDQKFSWNSVIDFCRKNIKYISAGIIVIFLVIVLAVSASNAGQDKVVNEENKAGEQATQGKESGQTEELVMDTVPEINTLIENYYTAYAAGDIQGLEACAVPITDAEKSYIALMNQYVEGYEAIHCYTKEGISQGEYIVSVAMNMKFEGIENTAPGLDFFYVRKNEAGAYYIDNLYSQFNLKNRELELDDQVEAFVKEYEAQEAFVKLSADVQKKYEEALAADPELYKVINETIPEALQRWRTELSGNGEQQSEQVPEPEEPTPPEEETVQTTSETVYATDNVNIRKEPNEDAQKVGSAVEGQSFIRTGVTQDGWSEIEFEGGKAYIKSDFLRTEASQQEGESNELNYLPEGTTLTLNNALNVRKSMSEDAQKIGTAEIGDRITVILSYQEGWTKVTWNDTEGYIRTDLLLNN